MSEVPRSAQSSAHPPLGSCQVLVLQGPVVHWRPTRTSLPCDRLRSRSSHRTLRELRARSSSGWLPLRSSTWYSVLFFSGGLSNSIISLCSLCCMLKVIKQLVSITYKATELLLIWRSSITLTRYSRMRVLWRQPRIGAELGLRY